MGAHFETERAGRGRCFATGWQLPVQAPGQGEVLAVLAGESFPTGLGPGYPVVRIDSGPWAGHEYYLGHVTSIVAPGERFSFSQPLAIVDQGQNHAGTVGGWVELGEAFGGQPETKVGPPWFAELLATPMILHVPAPPLVYGDSGIRVRNFSAQLRDCGYLPSARWRFDRRVHEALTRFKRYHNLAAEHGIYDDRVAVVLEHATEVCRRNDRKEV